MDSHDQDMTWTAPAGMSGARTGWRTGVTVSGADDRGGPGTGGADGPSLALAEGAAVTVPDIAGRGEAPGEADVP
ncbi:protein of unknown function [Blastococcus saxobsidens DD2]|uniref:Uncharacterized protein n=1 Tax=Blastococcus saxobsidens (strain DD2) TaxID=1146883 RepID=H6RQ35_BLASD|nr:protein of unknown function [Blastococcus saxobsidens DD2]